MNRFTLLLFRPSNNLAKTNVSNALFLRNSFSLIPGYRQISSETSGEQDPHSKIMEILRESTAMSNQTHTVESQVRYGKIFRYGELYAPHELNENNYKARSTGRRKPPTVDVFNTLKLNPLVEYKNYTLLSNFVSDMGRILPRSVTGLTAKNQRKLAKAIKRARSIGLIPSTHRRQVKHDIELMTSQMNKNNKPLDLLDIE